MEMAFLPQGHQLVAKDCSPDNLKTWSVFPGFKGAAEEVLPMSWLKPVDWLGSESTCTEHHCWGRADQAGWHH